MDQIYKSHLGRAIGRMASHHDGLNAIYMPTGTPAEIAVGAVSAANELKPSEVPFAILVSDDTTTDFGSFRVGRAASIQYRQGDRLAVVPSSTVDIASFDGSFREAMGPGFPVTAEPGFDVTTLARQAAAEILEPFATGEQDAVLVARVLEACMRQSADVLQEEREGAASWNALWFELVDKALGAVARCVRQVANDGHPLGYAVEDFGWACFGLPYPKKSGAWSHNAKQFVEALHTRWGSVEQVEEVEAEERVGRTASAASLSRCLEVGWDGLDDAMTRTPSALVGLQEFVSRDRNRIGAFQHIGEDAFFGLACDEGAATVHVAGGDSASISHEGSVPVYVLRSHSFGSRRASEWFTVRVPLRGPGEEIDLQGSVVKARVATTRYQLGEIRSTELVDGALEFVTRIEGKGVSGEKLDKVSVALEFSGATRGYLRSQTLTIYVLPPVEYALVYGPYAGKRVSTPRLAAPPDEESGAVELKAGTAHRLFLFSPNKPATTGVRLKKEDSGRGWSGDLPADTDATVACQGISWEFEASQASVASQSVLVAAVRKVTVSADDPDGDTMTSLLGQLEEVVATRALDPEYLGRAGHVVLPTNLSCGADSIHAVGEWLLPTGIAGKWSAVRDPDERPPEEWQAARAAFVEAWRACIDLLVPLATEGASNRWPSKRSTEELASKPELLEAMLDAYVAWNQASSEGDATSRFLAAYPFSFSGWDIADIAKLKVVLLSPWHPVRLAWTTAVESTLRKSERAVELMGSVEGWAFPMIGSAVNKRIKLIALPMEMGREDIFASWSMLVPLPAGEEEPIVAPSSLMGVSMPGTSASGLTASATDAALRDFRRVNSYLPSITIDLASSSGGRRMDQIDRSVLSAVRSWTSAESSSRANGGKHKSPVRGINVLDSLNRWGDLPREEVMLTLASSQGTMVSWRRYAPDREKPQRSNLRLLQDSGVRMALEDASEGGRRGVVGRIPLRRFEAPTRQSRQSAFLQPSLGSQRTAFDRALAAVEQPKGEAAKVGVYVGQSQLADANSDWSISGDAFVPAAVLARAIAVGAGGKRMLWEWRPPFLQSKGDNKLNRRPYASVMNVGSQLSEKLAMHLQRIDGDAPADAGEILATLGAQGIGLSSLLTMGGHHSSGALGFYLALRLLAAAQPIGDTIQVVMPIDACRQFLDVLSGAPKDKETTRQADLLVMRYGHGNLVLTPLEIKMYGLDGADKPDLAEPGPDLAEPLDQLRATTALLAKVQSERARLRNDGNEAERSLWDNALASLVEAGIRLSDESWTKPEAVQSTLQEIADGDYDLQLARPLVMFFSHASDATDEFVAYRVEDETATGAPFSYGALCSRPATVMRETRSIPQENRPLHKAWSELVEWAQTPAATAEPSGSNQPPHAPELSDPEIPSESANDYDAPTDGVVPRVDDLLDHSDASEEEESSSVPPAGAREEALRAPAGVSGDRMDQEPVESGDDVAKVNVPLLPGGVRVRLGSQVGNLSGEGVEFWPSNTATTQLNMGIVGDLGTGKTQLLKALMVNIRHASRATQQVPTSGLVFDYKRDFQDEAFVAASGAVVWKPIRIPLNVLELREPYSPRAAFKRASAFASMLRRIYQQIGGNQREKLITVIVEQFAANGGQAPTLGEVLEAYQVANPTSDSVTSILKTFVWGEVFSEDRSSMTTLAEAMRDTVLVVDLNDLGADTDLKNSIVVLFLDMYYEEMKRSLKIPPRVEDGVSLRNISSFLLVDEASNIMKYDFDVLESLLKEGREFGVGVILSSQYLSHFKSHKTNFAETLSTWFVHKVPNVTAKELSNLGIAAADGGLAERIKSLPVHQSLYKSDLVTARFIVEVPFWQLLENDGFADYRR